MRTRAAVFHEVGRPFTVEELDLDEPQAGEVVVRMAAVGICELLPQLASVIDDVCVIRSRHTDIPNHEPALLMMNSGNTQPTRPSLGSWLSYGLGTANQHLPGYVVLCRGVGLVLVESPDDNYRLELASKNF